MPRANPKKPAIPLSAKLPPGKLAPMDIARRFKCRYQRARDLMLSGQFGDTEYVGRTLCVTEEGVVKFEKTMHLNETKVKKGGRT